MDSKTSEIFFEKIENQYQEFWNERKTWLFKEEKTQPFLEEIYALMPLFYKESGGKTDEQKPLQDYTLIV